MSVTVFSSSSRSGISRVIVRLAAAAAIAGGLGALTAWSVPHLSQGLAPLANSAAPWVLVAVILALAARSVTEAVLIGVLSLVALTLGFYADEAHHGWAVDQHQVVFWCVSALVFGPIVGLAAGWLRQARALLGGAGAGAIGGILVGEGVRGLTTLKLSTPHHYWHIQILVGLGVAAGLTLWGARRRPWMLAPAGLLMLLSGALASVVTLAAYQSA